MPGIRPLLRLLGADTKRIDAALANIEEMQPDRLITVPDRFNDLFVNSGWVMHDSMHFETAARAVELAEADRADEAESVLLEHYSVEEISLRLTSMLGVRAFRPRMELAELALIDFKEGRYHASTPVVLGLADGLWQALTGRALFSKDAQLVVPDSIVGHSKGLVSLIRVLSRERQTTTTEPITIPYRNGILHGMDLGYANLTVAIKTWALLFATGDLARRIERPEQPARPRRTIADLAKTLADTADTKRRQDAWRPRALALGRDIPPSGGAEDYEHGSPERALVEFIDLWRVRNYGHMARYLSQLNFVETRVNTIPLRVRAIYDDKTLQSFQFLALDDRGSGMMTARTLVRYTSSSGEMIEQAFTFRLINEDDEGHLAPRGKPGTTWKLIDWELYGPVISPET